MKFKVGQRVRVVSESTSEPTYVGCEGTVERTGDPYIAPISKEPFPIVVILDKFRGERYFAERHLSPLTDPGFESFMERIQKPLTKPEWEAA